ncbi:MAG: PD40 domain-containing protein, partial [Planctomycetaceae bacterium]|nr:PD40 domain-containing protein [Planctomycetaceae bacterium]
TLYRLLTGYAPFEGEAWRTPAQRLQALTTTSPPEILSRRSDLPQELAELIDMMLSRDPSERPADMQAVTDHLQPFCEGHQLTDVWNRGRELTAALSADSSAVTVTPAALLNAAGIPDVTAVDRSPPVVRHEATSDSRSTRRRVVLSLIAFVLLFGGIRLKTDGGYIRIEHDASIDVVVRVLQNGQKVDDIVLEAGTNTFWYRSGQYEIRVPTEKSDQLEIVDGTFQLTRGQRRVVTIQRITEPPISAANAAPAATPAAGTEPPVNVGTTDRINWTVPEWLGPDINTEWKDDEPTLTADGLTMIFSSYCQPRKNGRGDRDLWITQRSDLSAPWGPVRNLSPNINSPMKETHPSISGDGRTLVFASNRRSGFGGTDLWVSFRESVDDDWSEPQNLGGVVNSEFEDSAPELAANQLTLFFASNRPGGFGDDDLFFCRRPTKESAWELPQLLPRPINSELSDGEPALSADQCVLIFTSDRPGGYGDKDLWLTTRSDATAPWSPPANLGSQINSASREGHAAISADGSFLIFASGRRAVSGPTNPSDADLFVSRRLNPSQSRGQSMSATPLVPRPAADKPPPPDPWPFSPEAAARQQQQWADYLQVPLQFTNDVGIPFRLIPAGQFLMGATESEQTAALNSLTESRPHQINERLDEQLIRSATPQREVILAQPFYMSVYETTNEQFTSGGGVLHNQVKGGPHHPVGYVSWLRAASFCDQLNAREGLPPRYEIFGRNVRILFQSHGYRLPTEAEWEFACRA